VASTQAKINSDMLAWARERAQMSISVLAEKLSVAEEKLEAWEQGEKYPTFKQAQSFATKTHIPFGYLYLATPPEESLPIPDLRTVGGERPKRPSAELIDIVNTILMRQQWYREFLLEQGAGKLHFIGKYDVNASVHDVVEDMRVTLNAPTVANRGSWEEYFSTLVSKIEDAGILVMRQGDVGHHSRPLSAAEFRGFAISDNLAPAIFINQADAPNPRLFTLIHELAHVWLGASGVSDARPDTKRREEILCNAVAAEFLVPGKEFLSQWRSDVQDWTTNIPELQNHFHVSGYVIARRALTLKKISMDEYLQYVKMLEEHHRNREKKDSGPTYYRVKGSQISKRFSKALLVEALSGRMLLRDAGKLLNIKPHNIQTFAKELGL
jgi:Zn-dependent peptidase ImmA (M78 family)/transcriptional regulator with XRE-family HTH domain